MFYLSHIITTRKRESYARSTTCSSRSGKREVSAIPRRKCGIYTYL